MRPRIHIISSKITGSISILVLIFGILFSTAIGGLALIAAISRSSSVRTEKFEEALGIAQAGIEYYRWHLAHNPLDFQDGTTQPGPYIHTFTDAFGHGTGSFSLTIDPPASGSSITTISSTGWSVSHPDITRTIKTRFGIPALSKYAFLHNANVWFGTGITVNGKILSNGGIRMDGVNGSTVQSSKTTYTCGTETGCSTPTIKDAVWGSGGPKELWSFPVPMIDFNSIAVDFSTMKSSAQNGGVYLGASGAYGYHIIFNAAGTYTIRKVTSALNRKGYSSELGCENLYQQISAETTIGTYSIATKPVIFVEDHLWVEGVVNGRVTVAAARFPLDANAMNIWIPNSITYLAKDGHSSLGLIAQNNIYFGVSVPTSFEINGALLAQKGRVIRHNYAYSVCSYYSTAVRNSLTLYGSLISNQKSYWNWGTPPSSGFLTRNITYDENLYFEPPPYFPTSGEYEFISWEEE